MADRILVRFEGPGSGVGELTWGQQQIWAAMQATDTSQSLRAVVPLPPGKSAADLAEELRFFMCRYESMRTRLQFDADGRPTQVVSERGEIAMELVDADESADPAVVADELADHWESTKFDYANEWPMRLAVVQHRGVATHVVVVLCHLAADGAGVAVMMAELAARDPLTGQAKTSATAIGPLELAQLQRSPAARRQNDSALRYWERLLRTATPRRFGPLTDRGQPRYRQASFSSPAMYLAAHVVAARTGGATSPVLLAAFAVALARITGINPVLTQAIVSNRFRPGLADVIHPVSQNGLLLIDAADVTFDEAIDRAQGASIFGSKHAYYDPAECEQLCERVRRDRGELIDIGCVYNDRRLAPGLDPAAPAPTQDEVRRALRQSTLRWGKPLPLFNEQLMITVDDAPGSVALLAEVDTHHVCAADVESILLEMEAVVVEAAFNPKASTRV